MYLHFRFGGYFIVTKMLRTPKKGFLPNLGSINNLLLRRHYKFPNNLDNTTVNSLRTIICKNISKHTVYKFYISSLRFEGSSHGKLRLLAGADCSMLLRGHNGKALLVLDVRIAIS